MQLVCTVPNGIVSPNESHANESFDVLSLQTFTHTHTHTEIDKTTGQSIHMKASLNGPREESTTVGFTVES